MHSTGIKRGNLIVTIEVVIVVGGGIIGLSCAWRLAQRGVHVTLFDAGALGGEASWAAAGMLAPGGEIEGAGELASLCMASVAQYGEFVRELEQESGCAIDYRVCGAIDLVFNEAEARALRRRAALQAALGIASEPWMNNGREGRLYPGDGLVNPRHLTYALAIACRKRGVDLREHEAVMAIQDAGHEVVTALGRYRGDGVVVSAGAWSGLLNPLLPPSFPVRGHLIGWQAGESGAVPIMRREGTYVVRRADGAMVAGSSTEHAGFDRRTDPQIVEDIRRRASELTAVPHAAQLQAWIGFRPGAETEAPVIGTLADTRIFTAYGHYRNGILLAPETARRVDALIASS